MDMPNIDYKNMWEDYASAKRVGYFDYKFNPTHRIGLTNYLRENLIYKLVNPTINDVVLDAGCASGRQAFKLADKINRGYGTDIAEKFIEAANQYKAEVGVDNLEFLVARVEQLPFENDFFDKVICAEVLEHVFDKDIALAELKRILKKDGKLIITVPNLNADGTLWGRFLRFIGIRKFIPLDLFSHDEVKKHGDAHVREFTKKSLINWVESQGFTVDYATTVSFIDGPGFDFLMKIVLHLPILKQLVLWKENFLTNLKLVFGRHLVIKLTKK